MIAWLSSPDANMMILGCKISIWAFNKDSDIFFILANTDLVSILLGFDFL